MNVNADSPLPLRRRIPALGWTASAAAAAAFVLALVSVSYRSFPRQSFLFKGGAETAARHEAVFSLDGSEAGNIWTVEVELKKGSPRRPRITIVLNGTPQSESATDRAGRRFAFAGEGLQSGQNILALESSEPWAFRRIRVRNVSGFASGLFEAVLVPRQNRYPGMIRFSASWPGLAWSAFCGMALLGLGFAAAGLRRIDAGGRLGRATGALRWILPCLPAGMVLTPILSPYRAYCSGRSLLGLAAVYLALGFVPELVRLAKGFGRAGLRTFGLGVRWFDRWAASVPLLRTGRDRLAAVLLALLLGLALAAPGGGRIWGDGLEYYTMMIGAARHGTVAITPEACTDVDRILGPNPYEPELPLYQWFRKNIPSLERRGGGIDCPHFWLYSVLAAVFDPVTRLLGVSPGSAFRWLHALLLIGAFLILRRTLGPPGGLGLLLIVLGSPLLWFIDKIQVEFFTGLLVIVGAGLLAARREAGAGLAFALASAQNPPFAALAGLAFLWAAFRRGRDVLKGVWPLWLASFGFIALAPAYYFLGHGVLNPVLAVGGARLGGDPMALRKMLAIMVDPDIGLFPAWPLGLLLAGWAAAASLKRRPSQDRRIGAFVLSAAFLLLWSQARTSNLNHGGTLHISRYAVWYLGFFFLFVRRLLDSGLFRRPAGRAVSALAALLGILSAVAFWPSRPETYLVPTRLSAFLYDKAPGLFNPVPEVFFERMRGTEEAPPKPIWAVANPSGNKVLVFRDRMLYIYHQGIPEITTAPDLNPIAVYRYAEHEFRDRLGIDVLYLNGLGGRFRRNPAKLPLARPGG